MQSPFVYGDWAPAARSAAAFVVVSAVVWGVRPDFAFAANGEPLRWAYNPPRVKGRWTWVPWWMPGLAAAAVAGVFI